MCDDAQFERELLWSQTYLDEMPALLLVTIAILITLFYPKLHL